jgi:hypothetical protein
VLLDRIRNEQLYHYYLGDLLEAYRLHAASAIERSSSEPDLRGARRPRAAADPGQCFPQSTRDSASSPVFGCEHRVTEGAQRLPTNCENSQHPQDTVTLSRGLASRECYLETNFVILGRQLSTNSRLGNHFCVRTRLGARTTPLRARFCSSKGPARDPAVSPDAVQTQTCTACR